MPSYETLDAIADAYTPLLALVSLTLIILPLFNLRWQLAGVRLLTVTGVLLIAYGLMFLDGRFEIWSTFGLDYSTHTAVALGLTTFVAINNPKLTTIWFGSLIAYVLLMLYQQYHTVADIAVTGAVVIVPTWLLLAFFYKRWPFPKASITCNSGGLKRHTEKETDPK